MDRGHPVRGGWASGVNLLSPSRSPCSSLGLVSLSVKGADSRISLLFPSCESLPPIFYEHCLHASTGAAPGTQGRETNVLGLREDHLRCGV